MSNKATGIYFLVFAVLYFGYTTFIAGHGIHWTNSILTLVAVAVAIYYFLKN